MENLTQNTLNTYTTHLTFVQGKKKQGCEVRVTDEGLSWTLGDDSSPPSRIESNIGSYKILTALVTENNSPKSSPSSFSPSSPSNSLLVVHCVQPKIAGHALNLTPMTLTFSGAKDSCTNCAQRINDMLLVKEPQRPKRMLLFVNPTSGGRKAEKVYRTKVAPILELMGIHVDMRLTEPGRYIEEVIAGYDLSSIDVIVAMGGDGTLVQVCEGLIKRQQKDSGIDMNDLERCFVSPSLPIAVIASGTGNGQAVIFNYTKDMLSSVYTLVLGHRRPRDITTMTSNGVYQSLSMIIIGFGLMGLLREHVESKKWMGAARYLLAIPFFLKKRDPIEVEIEYLTHDDPQFDPTPADQTPNKRDPDTTDPHTTDPQTTELDSIRPEFNDPVNHPESTQCNAESTHNNPQRPERPTWKKFTGPINFINVFPIVLPGADTTSGCIYLTWVKPCSLSERCKYMKRLVMNNIFMDDLDFVETQKVSEFRVRSTDDTRRTRILEFDGEYLEMPEPDLYARLHGSLVDVIAMDPKTSRGWASRALIIRAVLTH